MELPALPERFLGADQKRFRWFTSHLLFGHKNRLESASHACLKMGRNAGKGVLGSLLSEVITEHILCFIGYSNCGTGDRTGKILNFLELLI